ncbi:MAG: Cas10/Cmr2 second palm domain-containing protein, partial [Acidimicrobiales bacterium]
LATFSQALQAATAEALVHAVSACHPSSTGVGPDYAGLAAGPVLPVIVGGDDVVVFSAPALGLPLAIEFARSFEKATSSAIGERLTAGTGVVIAHASTPFGTLDAAAHRLQKKAKALHRRVGGSTVAFAIVSGGPSGDVGPERLDPSDALSHARSLGVDAYSVDDAALLVTTALKLKALGTPPSKLRQLAEVLRASHHGVDADWELVLASRSMSQARGLIERVAELPPKSKPSGVEPWRDLDGVVLTAVPDLLALAAIL